MTNRFGFMVHESPVEQCIDYAVSHKIKHLELDLRQDHSLLKSFSPQRIVAVRERSRLAGISLSLHPPFNKNLCSKVPFVRMNHVHYLKKTIRLAHQLGAGHITLHLGNFYRFAVWASSRQNAIERLYKVIDKLLPYCETHRIILALENMVPIPAEAGYSFLGDNIDDFKQIFSRYNSEYIKFCLDIGHANTAEGAPHYVNQLGEKIVSTHFHDNLGRYDDHMNVGTGTVPWRELVGALKAKGFTGPFISECIRSQPHQAIAALQIFI